MKYQAILFDFDGVLVDSEPIHHSCWHEILLPFGIDLDWNTYERSCIGITDRAMLESLCALGTPPLDIERLWIEYPRKKAMFRERIAAADPVSGAVRDLLASVERYPLAVVSSSGRAEVEPVLVAAGIRSSFRAVICREDVTRYKPDPEPYRRAAEVLGVARALVVEDSEAGVASARAAGFDVVRVKTAAEMPAAVRQAISC